MHRTDGVGTVATMPAANAVGPVVGYFQNAAPGPGVSPTYFDPDWCQAVQEELMTILEAAGVTSVKGTYNQVLAALQILGRIKLTANLALYVNAGSGNDANSGLSSGSAFATPQRAWNILQTCYDLNGFTATINLAAGTYAPASGVSVLAATGPVLGATAPASVRLAGVAGSTFLSATNAIAINASNGAFLTVSGITVSATGALPNGIGLQAASGGQVAIGSGVVFGACAIAHMSASNAGNINCLTSYSITGASTIHWFCNASVINASGITITLTGTPAFASAFANAQNVGVIAVPSITFSGSATGLRYQASANGVVNTSGGGATYLPGGTAGAVNTGGQYL